MKVTLGFLIIITISLVAFPLAAHAQGFTLIPCGKDIHGIDPNTPPDGLVDASEQCTLRDLFVVISRLINYLVSIAALVAIYYIVIAGFWLATSLGNPEVIARQKQALRNAIIGFVLIVTSFVFVNLLVNGIFGDDDTTRRWWEYECLFNVSGPDCPL